MRIVDLSIKRPVTILMGSLALVLFGLLAYFSLPVSLLPETELPFVSVQTVYPGASPITIETQLTKRIEDAVFSIADLDSITSYSMDSVSIVSISFKDGKDENLALQEVKDQIDAIIADLPESVQKPVISKENITSGTPVMNILLEGDMPDTELYAYVQSVVRDELAQVTGVGSVDVSGGVKREILVEPHRPPVAAAVFERYLPVEMIAGLLAESNIELPAGNANIEGQDIPIRFKGEFDSLEAIENTDIPTGAGVFKLRQIADVRDWHSTARERTIFLDKPAGTRSEGTLLLQITKNPSANTVSVIDGVTKRLPRIEQEAGGAIRFKVIREDASFIRDSVSDTWGNLFMGIVLTALVLFVFLHDWRSTVIISIAMPFSIVSTFLVMQTMHISVNVLSLMGLSCAVGTLVANSVVVLENIFRHKEQGLSRAEAASKGTKEVIMAVIASTLTNVAVFVPLGGMRGTMGQIISHFAYTVVISTIFSIVVSFTVTPLLASRLLPEGRKKKNAMSKKLDAFFLKLETLYAASIAVLLKRRLRSVLFIAAVFVLFIASIAGFTKIKMELVPRADGGKIQVDVELPQGSGLEQTAVLLANIERRLAAYPEVVSVLTRLGTGGLLERDVSVARMEIALVPKAKRARSNDHIAAAMVRTLVDVPGADIRVTAPTEVVILQGAPVDIYLRGPDSAVLQQIGGELREKIKALPGVMHTTISSKAGKSELVFEPNRKQISQDGLLVQQVAIMLRAAVDGLVATTYREGGMEYDIRVKLAGDLTDIEDIRNIPVMTDSGIYPLSRYANVRFENGYNMIMRINKARTVEITADLLPGYAQSEVTAQVARLMEETVLPAGYSFGQTGLSDEMSGSIVSMGMVFITAVLLVYMLLAAILESLVQPLFILSTVPLSIIGIVAACLVTGTVLNIIAMIGIVMLVGIVVNNAILLLDNYNYLRHEGGLGVREALIQSGATKLKAILMCNIAIILGMIPMALGIGASLAEMRQPMGIIVSGGIVSSMIMTLWLIPCLEFVLSYKKGEKI